ncbi:DUF4424 family protein [uncultured Cohaesibacter sp.]|uniref:DUF4424 family protein n=1 Tax=uncultured Cohaesibacter sp. TaxID=1002546 RepID=UPI0029C91209|nr:DUF4424 family protein [uncultured Cohaesibacter sp.]
MFRSLLPLGSLSRRTLVPTVLSSALLVAGVVAPQNARANDSTAMIEAGGIELVETPDISLDVEDLYISPSQIRIHYEFFNHSSESKRMLVAFPVPEISAEPEENYGIDNSDPVNFLGFTVLSNGRPVPPDLEIKLTMNGRDYTKLLVDNGVPLHRFSPDYYDQVENIPMSSRKQLADQGLIDWTPGEEWYGKNWKVKATYYWWQEFPANSRTVLDHSYSPVVGGGIVNEQYGVLNNVDRFCIEDSFIRGFRKLLAKGGHPETISKEVRYILQTANNWLGPIGDFRLVLDKEKPDNLITLCINGLRKIAPTQFEFRAQNFVPDRDIDMMVVEMPNW